MIGAFHANNGLFFKRNEDGSVWVEKRVPTVTFGAEGETHNGPMAVVEHWHLDADSWASAVASVCKRGEVGETFGEALDLHNRGWDE